jgi:hypothetical protein
MVCNAKTYRVARKVAEEVIKESLACASKVKCGYQSFEQNKPVSKTQQEIVALLLKERIIDIVFLRCDPLFHRSYFEINITSSQVPHYFISINVSIASGEKLSAGLS